MTIQDWVANQTEETSLWRSVLTTTSDAVYYLDVQGRYRYVNPAALRVLGRELHDVIGKTWQEMGLDAQSMSLIETQRLTVIATGQPSTSECTYLTQGELHQYEFVISPVKRGAGDEVIGTYTVSRDITQRKQTEAKLAQLTRYYNTLNHARQAILHAKSPQSLFESICAILTEHSHLLAAWIILHDSEKGRVSMVAQKGAEQFTAAFSVSMDPNIPAGCGSTARAIREGRYHVHMLQGAPANEREEYAVKVGIRASAAFPIRQAGEVIGALTVLFPQAEEVTDDTIGLIDGLMHDISFALDAMQDRQALQESRELLEEAQQIAQIGHWSMAAHSQMVKPSRMANRIFGREPDAPPLPISEVIALLHPDDKHLLSQAVAELQETLAPVEMDYRVIPRYGEVRWIHSRYSVTCNAEGQPDCVFGTVQDVTERLLAERALRESEVHLAEAQRLARLGHWSMDVASRMIDASAEAKRIWFRDPDAPLIALRDVFDFLIPEDREDLLAAAEYAIQHGVPAELEYRLALPDGKQRWIFTRAEIAQNEQGMPGTVFGIVQDITERKQIEQALRESELRWQFALEGADEGVWDWDVETGQIYFSPRWKEMLGYAVEDIKDDILEWDRRLHPQDKRRVYETISHYLRNTEAKAYACEYRMLAKDGNYHWVMDRGKVVVWTEQGLPKRIIGTHTDISERKRAEEALRESEALRTAILDSTRDAIIAIDAEHKIVLLNEAAAQMHGFRKEEIIGQSVTCLMPRSRWDLYFNYVQAIEFDQASSGELRRGMGMRSDGSEFPVEISINKTRLNGQVLYNLVVRDISVQEKADRELRLLAQVFSASAEAICILDTERRVISINPAFTQITGYTAEDIVGQQPDLLHSERYESDFYPKLWVEMRRSGTWQGEIWYRHKTGREFAAWITLSQVVQKGGQPTHFVSAFTDITERKRSEERIRYMASHDTLTGLPNRVSLDVLLTQSMAQARRSGNQVAVLFLDLDRFKTVNDSLGHHVGDMLLQAVAQRLRSSLRESDAVARQGGDEFIIVIPEVHSVEHEVLAAARHVLDAVAKPYRVNDMELTITPSIGISLYPDDGTDIPTLIKHADAAMYAAKEAGRGSIRFFSRDMAERARERLSLENHLRSALARSELVLYYQPQIDIQSGRVVAVEALLRWFHPDLGLVSPGIFIPVAEESGLIVSIGRWVLHEACRQNRIWQELGLPQVPMAVNLSALQFEQQRLDEIVSSALADSGLDACWLELELTEGILIRDVEGTQRMLETLKNMGVHLSVDDFGTGYSSLSYLKRFPLDKLKIDRSFVMDLAVDQNDAVITAAIIGLGHHLGLRVVAEGVETQEQLTLLRAWGCDGIQGDLILPAAPPEHVQSLLAAQAAVVRSGQL